ncbi:MAG TPA: BrnA antitoxin family protein [Acidobacteriaceae bacterium]|nr:BrnA antitoxin family protein [Acidobacteriaceae bacterium]
MKKPTRSKKITTYELKPGRTLTAQQRREIEALAKRPDEAVDTSDLPELPRGSWKHAVRGKWYRPVKQAVSIRLDADVLAWLRGKGSGYQTRLNALLREKMQEEIRK